MKNPLKLLICCGLLFLPAANLFPQQPINGVLISSAVSLQKTIARISEEISGYEKKIVKCQNTISNSEKIQKMAAEKNNKEAYRISSEAIATSKQSVSECRNFIAVLAEKKKKNEQALAEVKKAIESKTDKTNAVLLKCRGTVSVINKNGNTYDLASSHSPCIEAGDVISTARDGFASFDFLEGRGSLTIGPDSKVKMTIEKDTTHVLDVMKGTIYSGVLKADEYEKKISGMYHDFSSDSLLKSISYYSSLSEDQWIRLTRKEIISHLRKSKFEVRTPSAVCGVRGTQFTISVGDNGNTEIHLIEGKVEVMPLNSKNSLFITEGQSFIMNTKDDNPQVIQTDTLNIKKWWKYEE